MRVLYRSQQQSLIFFETLQACLVVSDNPEGQQVSEQFLGEPLTVLVAFWLVVTLGVVDRQQRYVIGLAEVTLDLVVLLLRSQLLVSAERFNSLKVLLALALYQQHRVIAAVENGNVKRQRPTALAIIVPPLCFEIKAKRFAQVD